MKNSVFKKTFAAAILLVAGASLSGCVVAPPRPYYAVHYIPVYHSYWTHIYYR